MQVATGHDGRTTGDRARVGDIRNRSRRADVATAAVTPPEPARADARRVASAVGNATKRAAITTARVSGCGTRAVATRAVATRAGRSTANVARWSAWRAARSLRELRRDLAPYRWQLAATVALAGAVVAATNDTTRVASFAMWAAWQVWRRRHLPARIWHRRGDRKWDIKIDNLLRVQCQLDPPPTIRRRAGGRLGHRHGRPAVDHFESSTRYELECPREPRAVTASQLCTMWATIKSMIGDGCHSVSLIERDGSNVTMIVVYERPYRRVARIDAHTACEVFNADDARHSVFNRELGGWVHPHFAKATEFTGRDVGSDVELVTWHDLGRPGDVSPTRVWTDPEAIYIEGQRYIRESETFEVPMFVMPEPVVDAVSPWVGRPRSYRTPEKSYDPLSEESCDGSYDSENAVLEAEKSGFTGAAGERGANTPPPAVENRADVGHQAPAHPVATPINATPGSATSIVWALLAAGTPMTRSQLALRAGMTPRSVSNLLTGWARDGLCERTEDGWTATMLDQA